MDAIRLVLEPDLEPDPRPDAKSTAVAGPRGRGFSTHSVMADSELVG